MIFLSVTKYAALLAMSMAMAAAPDTAVFHKADFCLHELETLYQLPSAAIQLRSSEELMALSLSSKRSPLYTDEVGTGATSVLDLLQINRKPPKNIVLVSFNRFLGDNATLFTSMLETLREQYPHAAITFLTPNTRAMKIQQIKQKLNIDVQRLDYKLSFEPSLVEKADASLKLAHELPSTVKRLIAPGSLVLFDNETLEEISQDLNNTYPSEKNTLRNIFYGQLREVGAAGVGFGHPSYEKITYVGPTQTLPNYFSEIEHRYLTNSNGTAAYGITFNLPRVYSDDTIYGQAAENVKLLLGDQSRLVWSSTHYVDLQKDLPRARNVIKEIFPRNDQGYVFINLNTFGRRKAVQLQPYYIDILESISQIISEEFPTLNQLVVAPEAHFGESIGEAAVARVKGREHVALLEGHEDIYEALLYDARLVISYDSGMVHVAAFKAPESVLTLSLSEGKPHYWRRPDQNFVSMPNTQAWREHLPKIRRLVRGALVRHL